MDLSSKGFLGGIFLIIVGIGLIINGAQRFMLLDAINKESEPHHHGEKAKKAASRYSLSMFAEIAGGLMLLLLGIVLAGGMVQV